MKYLATTAALIVFVAVAGHQTAPLAQSTPLRGLDSDPRANLPSAGQLLDRQQNNQRGSLSNRTLNNESERRQNLQRIQDQSTACQGARSSDCTPKRNAE
ncbi:hypothetical protein [Roseibium sp.]|uniref:hypothetical protein n=1 Tax=Roseibium sp. TaxID=1936156 RepID=UPI003265E4A5